MAGNKKKYSHIVSLGYNCEISFQFLRYFDYLDSNLFAWSYIPTNDSLLQSINNLDNLLNGEITGPHPLYECANTKIRFHGRSVKVFNNLDIDEETRANDIIELKSRINYLKGKFEKVLNSDCSVLYVIKLKSPEFEENNWDSKNINFVKMLYELLLQKRNNKPFELLIILESKYSNENWKLLENDKIHIRTVNNFSPEENVGNSELSDIKGWNKIFNEFQPKNKPKHAVIKSFWDFRTDKRFISLYLFKLFLPNIIRIRMLILGYKLDFCLGKIKE